MLEEILNSMAENWSMGFIPHGHCFLWKPELIYLNVGADAIISLSYYSIPITLADLIRRRTDLPFNWLFGLFGLFILSCGTGHLADIWTLWHPDYWLSTTIKTITASVSIVTAIALIINLPNAMKLPSPQQLREANFALAESKKLLADQNLDLETQVKNRTAELVTAKQTAESASMAKTNFIANISHELRTPLNAIIGFTELMLNDLGFSANHRENLEIIKSSGDHLLSLINNLLNISYIEAGKDQKDIATVHLPHLLETIQKMMLLKASNKNIELKLEIMTKMPKLIKTDPNKLKQILLNLVANAIKFTNRGYVKIWAGCSGENTLIFKISDTGIGIAENIMASLFEPFNSTTKKIADGTGLGLHLSQKLAQVLGGNIQVTTELHAGTTMTLEIPAVVATEDLEFEIYDDYHIIGLEANQPTYRVLIVDDQYTSRRLLVKTLAGMGIATEEASSGKEAVDKWLAQGYDLIFMDLQMPMINGYEAAQTIRARTDLRQPPIIALTADMYSEQNDGQHPRTGFTDLFTDLIFKPFKVTDIGTSLRKHLGVKLVTSLSNSNPQPDLALHALGYVALPLLKKLQDALHSCDLDALGRAISDIRSCEPELAKTLEAHTKQFRYEIILEAIAEILNPPTL